MVRVKRNHCRYFSSLRTQPFQKKINLKKNLMLIGRRVVLPSEGEESLLDSFQAPADISQQWGQDESEITTASHEIHTKVEKLQICAVQSNHYLPLYSSQFKNHIIYCVAPLCRARPGCCNHETLISLHTKYRSNMYVLFCSLQRQFLQYLQSTKSFQFPNNEKFCVGDSSIFIFLQIWAHLLTFRFLKDSI